MGPKTLEPRGALTLGVPVLQAQVRICCKTSGGHRGDGDRKPTQEPKGGVSGGWGSRSVDLTTQRYDPRGVTFHCTSVYVCSPIACVWSPIAAKIAMCPTQSRRWPRKPKPRVSGEL